jgi:hypothetical protein
MARSWYMPLSLSRRELNRFVRPLVANASESSADGEPGPSLLAWAAWAACATFTVDPRFDGVRDGGLD